MQGEQAIERTFGRFTSIAHMSVPRGAHPRLLALNTAWQQAPKVQGIPLRRSVGLEEIPGAMGYSGIVDVLPTGRFRYRLFGSALVAALGYDVTGRETVDLEPADYSEMVTAQYSEVTASRRAVIHEIRSMSDKDKPSTYFRFTAPLTLESGDVDQLWMTVAMLGTFGRDVFSAETTGLLPLRD